MHKIKTNTSKKTEDEKPPCPKCGKAQNIVKNGKVRKKQRWRCKICKCDFFTLLEIKKRKPKFKYLDLKMLAILLNHVGVDEKSIFNYVISRQKSTIKNDQIVRQWIKQLNLKREKLAEITVIDKSNAKSLRQIISDIKEKLSLNDKFYLVYFPLKLIKTEHVISFINNGETNIKNEFKATQPWFQLIASILLGCTHNQDLSKKFNLLDYNENTWIKKAFNTKLSYKYEMFYSGVQELNFIDIEDLVKSYTRQYCIILFDKHLKNPYVYLVKHPKNQNVSQNLTTFSRIETYSQ